MGARVKKKMREKKGSLTRFPAFSFFSFHACFLHGILTKAAAPADHF
jgi:hypothetical protein